MRILLLNHNQEFFGSYFRCRALGEEIARRGHQVRLVCASGRKFDLRIRRQIVNENFEILTLPRIKYHTYYSGQLLRLPLYCAQVVRWRCDLVHAYTVAQPQIAAAALLARIMGKPLIIDWDDLWGDGFGATHGAIVNKVLKVCEEGLLPHATAITAISEFLLDRAIAVTNGKTPTLLVPPGCELSPDEALIKEECRRRCGLAPDAKILVAMGNTYVEGLGFLFDAFRRVLQEEPSARLVMVGHVELPDTAEARQWQAEGRLMRTSFISGDALQDYLGSADVLVLPMCDHPVEYARFPSRLPHYLSIGRPVLSNAVGDVRRYLTEYGGGLASPLHDAGALAENIVRVLRDPALAASLGQQARTVARTKLAWNLLAKDLETLYLDVCGGARDDAMSAVTPGATVAGDDGSLHESYHDINEVTHG